MLQTQSRCNEFYIKQKALCHAESVVFNSIKIKKLLEMTDVVRRDQVMENKFYKKQFYSQNVKS